MKKYVYYSIVSTLTLISLAGMAMQIREYHMRYLHHRKEASRAEVYLDSQVCVDARVKANLDGFHRCEEAARILEISPWVAAWYDIVENWHVCGHGRCELLLEDITQRVPTIVWGALVVLCFLLYNQFKQTAQIQRMQQFHIPYGYERLHNVH